MTDEKEKTKKMKPLRDDELSAFSLQMALMMRSGIPAEEALRVLAEDAADEREKQWLLLMAEEMSIGISLHQALAVGGGLPRYAMDMVRIGEMTGRLDDVWYGLYEYYAREHQLRQSVKSAVTYPVVMVIMMAVVVVVLLTKVLPVFEQVFALLGTTVSPLTAALLRLGSAMNNGLTGLLVVLILLAAFGAYLYGVPSGQELWKKWQANCFGLKKLAIDTATRNFTSAMSMCLASGLDMDESLDMVEQLVVYKPFQERIANLRKRTAEGEGFAQAVAESNVLTGQYARMLSVGFRSGQTDSVMKEIAQRSDEAVEERLNHMVGLVEPLLVAILSIGVGIILIAVMLPLMGVMSSMI